VVPSFWDRFNFMLSLLEKQVTALMNLHPKLLPPPVRSKFKDFGSLDLSLVFWGADNSVVGLLLNLCF